MSYEYSEKELREFIKDEQEKNEMSITKLSHHCTNEIEWCLAFSERIASSMDLKLSDVLMAKSIIVKEKYNDVYVRSVNERTKSMNKLCAIMANISETLLEIRSDTK